MGCMVALLLHNCVVSDDFTDARLASGSDASSGGTAGQAGAAASGGAAAEAGAAASGGTPAESGAAAGGGAAGITGGAGGAVPSVETVAADDGKPHGVFVGSAAVFWTSFGKTSSTGTVKRVRKTDLLELTLATGQADPRGLIWTESYVYWASTGDATVRRVPDVGGSVENVLTLSQNQAPRALAALPGKLLIMGADGSIHSLATANKQHAVLHAGTGIPLLDAAEDIVTDGKDVFVPYGGGTYYKLDLNSCASSCQGGQFDSSAQWPVGLLIDGDWMYLATQEGSLRRYPLLPGAPENFGSGNGPRHFAATATHVYWTNSANGTIGRVDKVTKLGPPAGYYLTGFGTPIGIGADGTHVWIADASGSLKRFAH